MTKNKDVKEKEQKKFIKDETDLNNKSNEDQFKEEKEKYLRIIADYENKIKRTQQDVIDIMNKNISNIIKNITPIIDDLTTVHSFLENEHKESINLIIKNMKKILKQNGVEEIIPSENETFNPDLHQAISCEESDLKEGSIIRTIKNGYRLYNHTITPALVVTAK